MINITLCVAVFFNFYSCKKDPPKPPPAPNAYVSFSTPVAAAFLIIDNKLNDNMECIYNPGNPSAGYFFQFVDSAGGINGVTFVITGDSSGKIVANKSFTYKYIQPSANNLSTQCRLFVSVDNVSVTGYDSPEVTVNISRFSHSTMDGIFSEKIWGTGADSGFVPEGVFYNVLLVNR